MSKALRTYLLARLQHMAKDDILSFVDEERLADIKEEDPNPTIKVYSIAEEGKAIGNLEGRGNTVMNYVEDAISKLYATLGIGTPAFHRHGKTNSHVGREPIGEIIGKTLRVVGGKLSAIAAVYMPPKFAKTNFDVASIETDVRYTMDSKGEAYVHSFDSISGLALGTRGIDKPGFPGATLLASMQAFAAKEKSGVRHMAGSKGKADLTQDEIRELIAENGFSPEDLFDEKELLGAEPVRSKMQQKDGHIRRIEGKNNGRRKGGRDEEEDDDREERRGGKSQSALEKKVDDMAALMTGLAKDNLRDRGRKHLDTLVKELKVDQRFLSTLKEDFEELDLDVATPLAKQVKTFVEGQNTRFLKMAKTLGLPPVEAGNEKERVDGDSGDSDGQEPEPKSPAPKKEGAGVPPPKPGENPPPVKDTYADPKKNDFIP